MKSLSRILIIRFTILIAAVLVGASLFVILPLRSFTFAREQDRLKNEAQVLARDLKRFFSSEEPVSDIDAELDDIAGGLPLRITIVDMNGRVLGDSYANAQEMGDHSDRPEVAGALEGEITTSQRESSTVGKQFIYAAAPVQVNGVVQGVVRVSSAEEDVMPVVFQLWWIFLGAFGLLLLATVAISIWTERRVVGSLSSLREAASDIASGDLERRVKEPEIQDFKELARDFNTMAEQIGYMVEEASEERAKLQAILDNISAGILVTDSSDRIILMNPAANEILGVQEMQLGSRVIELTDSEEFVRVLATAKGGERIIEEIELSSPRKANLMARSNPVVGSGGEVVAVVTILEDITKSKQLDRIRQDFVANVSHELRTPVASVKALTDTLVAGALAERETAKQFIDDLDHETTRLAQLVEDLLTLSKLEARETALDIGTIPARKILQDCVDVKAKLAEEYEVEIKIEEVDRTTVIEADSSYIQTAINNLLDNAIKYNRQGGQVTIAVRPEGNWHVITVTDTGIGIPPDDMPRVFERFYRVDRTRSRETGGTGLGLSIVKHISELHGGRVTAISSEGEGSTFSVYIPRS